MPSRSRNKTLGGKSVKPTSTGEVGDLEIQIYRPHEIPRRGQVTVGISLRRGGPHPEGVGGYRCSEISCVALATHDRQGRMAVVDQPPAGKIFYSCWGKGRRGVGGLIISLGDIPPASGLILNTSYLRLFAKSVPTLTKIGPAAKILPNYDIPPTSKKSRPKLPIGKLEAYNLLREACRILGAKYFPPSSTITQRQLRVLYRRLREGATADDLLAACREAKRAYESGQKRFLQLRNLLYVWGTGLPALLGAAGLAEEKPQENQGDMAAEWEKFISGGKSS